MQFFKLIINDLNMNIDPSSPETFSNQSSLWSDENIVRSYTCTFCKRGFSNAQALGGHMNIHRKDRAKLKEFSRENLLSLDINQNYTEYEDCPEAETSHKSLSLESEEAKKVDPEGDMAKEGLRLFVERSDKYGGEERKCYEKNKIVERSEKELINDKIDLELRLGPDARMKTK